MRGLVIILAFAVTGVALPVCTHAQDRQTRREQVFQKLHGEPCAGPAEPLTAVDQDITIDGRAAQGLRLMLKLVYARSNGSDDPADIIETSSAIPLESDGQFHASFSTLTHRLLIMRYSLRTATLEIDTLYGRSDVQMKVTADDATPLLDHARRIVLHREPTDDGARIYPSLEIDGPGAAASLTASDSPVAAPAAAGSDGAPRLAIRAVDGQTHARFAIEWAE